MRPALPNSSRRDARHRGGSTRRRPTRRTRRGQGSGQPSIERPSTDRPRGCVAPVTVAASWASHSHRSTSPQHIATPICSGTCVGRARAAGAEARPERGSGESRAATPRMVRKQQSRVVQRCRSSVTRSGVRRVRTGTSSTSVGLTILVWRGRSSSSCFPGPSGAPIGVRMTPIALPSSA